jgi:hypothetical protein
VSLREGRFEGSGEIVWRRPALLMGAAIFFMVAVILGRIGAPGWGTFVEDGLAVALVFAFASNAYRRRRRGALHADAEGLRLKGKLVASRSSIAGAFLLSPDEPVVRIVRRIAPNLDVHLDGDDDARALVAGLGFGVGRSVVTFSAWRGGPAAIYAGVASASWLGILAGESLQHGGFSFAARSAMLIAPLVAIPMWIGTRSYTRVDVGSDGILLRRLGSERFLSYGGVSSVSVEGRAVLGRSVVIVLGSGESIRLATGQPQLREALVARIQEARTAFARADGSTDDARVAPGGRTVGRWVSDLRAMANQATYREADATPETLWRLLDDSSAPPATRAGAALALSASLDETSRMRLRVSAEACAEPKLRVALTRVAEGASDTELEEALTPLLESKS